MAATKKSLPRLNVAYVQHIRKLAPFAWQLSEHRKKQRKKALPEGEEDSHILEDLAQRMYQIRKGRRQRGLSDLALVLETSEEETTRFAAEVQYLVGRDIQISEIASVAQHEGRDLRRIVVYLRHPSAKRHPPGVRVYQGGAMEMNRRRH